MTKFKTLFLIAALGVLLPVATAFVIADNDNGRQSVSAEENHSTVTATAMSVTVSDVCNHAYEMTKEVAATCTEQGYTLYTCSICGETKKDNYTKESGHEYTETQIAATCTAKGYTICSKCGDRREIMTSPELGHRFVEIVVPENCTHKGYTTHFCTTCGYEYSDTYVLETGHSYEDETIPAT